MDVIAAESGVGVHTVYAAYGAKREIVTRVCNSGSR